MSFLTSFREIGSKFKEIFFPPKPKRSQIWLEGNDAYYAGYPISACPYSGDEYVEWTEGYCCYVDKQDRN